MKDWLFLTVLQHGNETSGWDAVREWLLKRPGTGLPRSLLLFVANPAAELIAVPVVAGRSYDRIWHVVFQWPPIP